MTSNSATPTSRCICVRVVIIVLAVGLGASVGVAQGQQAAKPQAQSQAAASSPCGAAATPGAGASQSAANASAAVRNAANAVSNLGSLFGKKKPAQPANQGASQTPNQPASQSAAASAACDPTVNAAAGAAAGVASTVDSVQSLGGPAAVGTGATPGAAVTQPGAASVGAPATSGGARAARAPVAPVASAAATPAPAANQPVAAAASAPALAPSAPPNFAKLPDGNGIQLGMTVEQALAKVKALYPNPTNMTVNYVKFEKTADKPWAHDIMLQTVSPQNNAKENLTVRFNDPPDEQRVLFVSRSLIFQQGKQTTLANMKAALLQKYGQPRSSRSETLIWSFDEQGNPLNDTKLNGYDCSGFAPQNNAAEGGDPGRPSVAQLGVDPAQDELQKNPCYSGVHIGANTGIPTPDGLVISLDVNMSESGYATRTYIDAQAYIKNAANQAQQEQFKKAQERSAPKL